jgi:hypothetical protein
MFYNIKSMKKNDRLFEFALMTVGFIGLLILFTLLFAGPGYIFRNILELIQS